MLFLSISLAAAGTLLNRNVSGNQIILAANVTAGTWRREKGNFIMTTRADLYILLVPTSKCAHLFTHIQQRFVDLLVDGPEDMEVEHKEATYACIFIPLINL